MWTWRPRYALGARVQGAFPCAAHRPVCVRSRLHAAASGLPLPLLQEADKKAKEKAKRERAAAKKEKVRGTAVAGH